MSALTVQMCFKSRTAYNYDINFEEVETGGGGGGYEYLCGGSGSSCRGRGCSRGRGCDGPKPNDHPPPIQKTARIVQMLKRNTPGTLKIPRMPLTG